MPARKDRLSLIITRMAAVAAVLAGFSLPLGYALVSLDNTGESLAFKAQVKAAALSDLIAGNPELWIFAENRIQGLISREPVALDNERVRVLGENDTLILESGPDLPGPVLARSYPLYDAGRAVGRLEIGASLRAMLFNTLLAGLLGLVLGAFVFAVMKILPLRALRRATNRLFEEKQRAQITLHAISDGVISTDAQGHVQYLNPTAESLLGRRLDEVRGQALAEVFPGRQHDPEAARILPVPRAERALRGVLPGQRGTAAAGPHGAGHRRTFRSDLR